MKTYYKPLTNADKKHDGLNLIRKDGERADAWLSKHNSDLRDVANDFFKEEIQELFNDSVGSDPDGATWVTFRPDYTKVKGVLKRKWNYYGGEYRIKPTICNVKLSGSRLPFDRRNLYVMQQFASNQFFTTNHNMFEIRVGFLSPEDTHNSWDGKSSIQIGKLYRLLGRLGFDPLFPIRRKEFIAKVEEKMASAIIDRTNDRNVNGVPARIKAKLIPLGNSIRDFVQDYIQGGVKPALSNKTLSNRRWKKGEDSSLYGGKGGINEALYETGQLCEAVQVKIVSWRDNDAIKKIYEKIFDPSKASTRQLQKAKKEAEEYKKLVEAQKEKRKKEKRRKIGYSTSQMDKEIEQRRASKDYYDIEEKSTERYKSEYSFLLNLMRSNKALADRAIAKGKKPRFSAPNWGLSEEQVKIFKVADRILRARGYTQ